jgi:hypothetical protein
VLERAKDCKLQLFDGAFFISNHITSFSVLLTNKSRNLREEKISMFAFRQTKKSKPNQSPEEAEEKNCQKKKKGEKDERMLQLKRRQDEGGRNQKGREKARRN